MTVYCPHCSTGYLLPDHLIGPRGARVRCPNCQGAFVVVPVDGEGRADGARPDFGSGAAPEHTSQGLAEASATAGPAVMEAERAAEASRSAAPPDARPAEAPAAIAAAVLEALVARLGDALVEARRRGRVLSEHGPEIMDAYAEYRRRAGVGAAPDAFRAALKGCCGVDLIPRREG
jgi:predicted Zn finger-like uncharacterized protein